MGDPLTETASSMKRVYSYFFPVLLSVLAAPPVQAAECSYAPKAAPHDRRPEVSLQGECGELVGEDELRIYPGHLKKMSFTGGPAAVFVNDKVFYASKSGKTVRTCVFDNGADYFSEGLARTISGKKFGFVDKKLNTVIKPEYDFAFPFKKGIAVVCNACRPASDGEHRTPAGGRWGAINKAGKIVIPLENSREELENKLGVKGID